MQKNGLIEGNYQENPTLLKHKAFLSLIILFLLIKIGLLLLFPSRNLILASDLAPDVILRAVNEQRSLRNLVTLNTNSKLTSAAQSKTDDMQARHYFAHVDPDGHYIWDKIVAAGYTPYTQLGENLAIEFYDTDSLISAWMNSPTHRANLLQEGFKDQGLGLTFGDANQGQYHSAIANTFGTLALATPKRPIAPAQPAPKPVPVRKPVAKIRPTPTPKPMAKTLGSEQIASPAPAPVEAPNPLANQQPIVTPREEPTNSQNQSVDFALAQNASKQGALPAQSSPLSEAPALVGPAQSSSLNSNQANRYLLIAGGLALLAFMVFDLRKASQKQTLTLDKKAGNLAMLALSLVVVVFLYWF